MTAPTVPAAVVSGYHDAVRHDVVPWIPRTGGALLDVGGGTGATAAYLKRHGYARRAGTIDLIGAGNPAHDLDFQAVGSLDDAAFVDRTLSRYGPFETILCLDLLEHLVDPWALVARLHQALRPGGCLIASIPNVRHYRVSGGLFFGNRWNLSDAGILDRTHLRFFVKDSAIELLTHSGLVLEAVGAPARSRRPWLVNWFNRLTLRLFESFVTVDYVLRARRADPDRAALQ